MRRVLAALIAVSMAAPAALGANIDVGDHYLSPGIPGQTIEIYASGGETADSVNFPVVVADGYPGATSGGTFYPFGSIDGPNLTSVDLVSSGTVFGDVSGGSYQDNNAVGEQLVIADVGVNGTQNATVNGLLAVLTVDTTGWNAGDGPWDLSLDSFAGAVEFFGPSPITTTITNGRIFLTPEPGVWAQLVGLAAMGGLGFWFRRRKQKAA